MRIALVSDAWTPQVNGVVRTLQETTHRLHGRGHDVKAVTPDGFATLPCPGYGEIRLALGCGRALARRMDEFAPEAVHIATEGPLGWAARRWCLARGFPFTTSFHTRFPDYLALRTGLPAGWFWPLVRQFHAPAARTFVATATLSDELAARGLANLHRWSRGVDLTAFSPATPPLPAIRRLEGPILLYVGRVAVEKNIEAFLGASAPGTKVVVGDGPARQALAAAFPQAHFLGALQGADLAGAYAAADVLVFPSRTDTFGLVMVEALASGVPVAGYPVAGPIDIIGAGGTGSGGNRKRIGALDHDLGKAIAHALTADRDACAAEGRRYDWARCADQFLAGIAPIDRTAVTGTSPSRFGLRATDGRVPLRS